MLTKAAVPFPNPAHQTGRADFPASGFPTDFIADSRVVCTAPASQPKHSQLPADVLPRELAGALRGHLVPPSFTLRLSIQLDLKFPYFIRYFETHVNYLCLPFFTSSSEARVLPSPGVTRVQRYL